MAPMNVSTYTLRFFLPAFPGDAAQTGRWRMPAATGHVKSSERLLP